MNLQKYKNYFNKISVFFSLNSANYWNTITPCNVKEKPIGVGKYYLDFISKSDYIGQMSEEGIPLYELEGSDPFYHPIVICQYALGLFEKSILCNHLDVSLKNNFLNQADWLVKYFKEKKNLSGWHLNFEIKKYGIKAPWISAMAQGEAISVLVRANLLTNEPLYLKIAEMALTPFSLNVQEGGFVNRFEGFPIYEEYPSPHKTVGVLNGFIFSLFGLYDLAIHSKSEEAKFFFAQGVESLKNILKFYDLKYWSQYYLFDYPNNYPASFTYHILAAEQLIALHFLTGENIFLIYSEKWKKQGKSVINKLRILIFKIFYARTLS